MIELVHRWERATPVALMRMTRHWSGALPAMTRFTSPVTMVYRRYPIGFPPAGFQVNQTLGTTDGFSTVFKP
jgi:hypothetical protein